MRQRSLAIALFMMMAVTGTVSAADIDHNIILMIAEDKYYKSLTPMILEGETEPVFLNPRQSIVIQELSAVATKEIVVDSQTKRDVLEFRFTAEGARHLYSLTERNVGNRIALVIDGDVIIAPEIFEAIPNGIFYLFGRSSKEQLQTLERRVRKKLDDSAK